MKKHIIILLISSMAFSSKAQIDFSSFLEAGTVDAERLMEGYLEPAFLGFGYGINSGWYNTAKPHKLLGFDITPTVTMAMIPSSAESFTIDPNDYTNIDVVPTIDANGSSGSIITDAPTLFGPNRPNEELPFLRYTTADGSTLDLSAPTGLGLDEEIPFNAVPTAMVQFGIGLVKNTDIKLRIVPTLEEEGEYEFSMFGIGVMHDLKQWVPGLKQVPFDFSGFVGWNRMEATIFMDDNNPDQAAEFSTSGFTLQGIISKKFAIVTFFGGAGIATTTTKFSLLGDYDTDTVDLPDDPINFDYSSTGPRINVGMRLKLLIVTIHADYALQKYNTLTLGLGLSIR